jgi:hypothetical protein
MNLSPAPAQAGVTKSSACPFERTHGRPCLICRGGSGLFPADHPDHGVVADGADRDAAQQLYAERGLYLETAEIRDLTGDERAALDRWASAREPLGIEFAVRAHIAGTVTEVPGEKPRQACTRCHMLLQDTASRVVDGAYPVGAFVGLDCEGSPARIDEVRA